MSLLNTPCKHSQCRVEEVCEPSALKTGWPSFGSNNLNHMFSVVADQTCTTVRRNFGPFLFTKPFFIVGMMFWCLCAVPFFSTHSVVCSFLPNKSTVVSSVHRIFCQELCGTSRCTFANFRCAAIFFLDSSGVFRGVLPYKHHSCFMYRRFVNRC